MYADLVITLLWQREIFSKERLEVRQHLYTLIESVFCLTVCRRPRPDTEQSRRLQQEAPIHLSLHSMCAVSTISKLTLLFVVLLIETKSDTTIANRYVDIFTVVSNVSFTQPSLLKPETKGLS